MNDRYLQQSKSLEGANTISKFRTRIGEVKWHQAGTTEADLLTSRSSRAFFPQQNLQFRTYAIHWHKHASKRYKLRITVEELLNGFPWNTSQYSYSEDYLSDTATNRSSKLKLGSGVTVSMLWEVGHVWVKHAPHLTMLHVTSSIVYSSTDHTFHDDRISSPHLRNNLDEKTYSSCQKYVSVTKLRLFLK